jgi:predicted Zn-dependent peptidase
LGDITTNSVYQDQQVELEKQAVLDHHDSRSTTEYEKVLLENVHFNAYRESMLGQPRHGDMDVVSTLTSDHVRDFYN